MPLLGHHQIHFNRSLRPVADQQPGRQHRRQPLLILFSPGELSLFPWLTSDPFGLTDFPLDDLMDLPLFIPHPADTINPIILL